MPVARQSRAPASAAAEAAEEGASDLLNWIVDDLYDLVTGTSESEFKQLVAVYEENGPDHTKALLSALGDRGKELGLDILGGALSGLFLSGAKSGYNAVQSNRMGQEAFDTGSYRDYISLKDCVFMKDMLNYKYHGT